MESNKLVSLLQTLTAKEWRTLHKWVQSPAFNTRPEVVALASLLQTALQTPTQTLPDKEAIFCAIFPTKKRYDDHAVRIALSQLLEVVNQMLLHEHLATQSDWLAFQRADLYRQRNLPRHLRQQQKRALTERHAQPLRHTEWLWLTHQWQELEYRFESAQKRTNVMNLQAVSDSLDAYYIAATLRTACLALSHQAVFQTTYHFGLLPALLTHLQTSTPWQQPAIQVYYYCYQSMTHPREPSYFQQYVKAVFEYELCFPEHERKDLWLLAINYCIRRFNEGATEYAEQEMSLFKHALAKGYLISNGIMSRFTFRNIVSNGIYIKKFEWVESFIHTYKQYLEAEHRESVYSFSLARLAYERRAYAEALRLLQKVTYHDVLIALAAKTMMLKIYVEDDAYDLLVSHIEAMKIFLRRQKIIGYHKTNYERLLYFVQKILDAKDMAATQRIRQEIIGTPTVAEREWLLQMAV